MDRLLFLVNMLPGTRRMGISLDLYITTKRGPNGTHVVTMSLMHFHYPSLGTDTFTQILKEESELQDERLARPSGDTTSPSIKSAIPEVHHSYG